MFVRVKSSVQEGRTYDYLQIVESYRDGAKVKQRVIANLGRLEQLRASGAIDSILRGLARFSERLRVIEAARSPRIESCQAREWGTALVFGRLWERQGLPALLGKLAVGRKFGFDLERLCFALALQRLSEPGSDLQGSEWVKTVEAPGFTEIELQHFYRGVGWLAEVREELEQELYCRDRDLLNRELDLVFIDTTSTYVYRDEETEFCKRGYSRDKRPDLPQLVLCVAVDRQGWPISWEILPGNTADQAAFVQAIAKFRERFRIGRVSVVADRGMISKDTIELLEGDEHTPFDYILGCRLRQSKEVREQVLSRVGRYQEVAAKLKVKEVKVEERRYIVCRNEEEAERDARARERIVEKLREKLERGQAKSLVGNGGYRRFLKGEKGAWRIDAAAVEADARFDGVFVLRTNLALPAAEIAQTYKGLWRVERAFREEKSTLEVRPLFHHCDDNRIGHIVASFLALRLEVDLQRRLDDKRVTVSWPDLMRDLKRLQAVRMSLDGEGYLVRTDLEGAAYQAFQTAGVRVPAKVTKLKEPPVPTVPEQENCSAEEKAASANQLDLLDS